jgi:hypothetical protein
VLVVPWSIAATNSRLSANYLLPSDGCRRPSWTTWLARSSTLTACPEAAPQHPASIGYCRPTAWSTSTAMTSTRRRSAA